MFLQLVMFTSDQTFVCSVSVVSYVLLKPNACLQCFCSQLCSPQTKRFFVVFLQLAMITSDQTFVCSVSVVSYVHLRPNVCLQCFCSQLFSPQTKRLFVVFLQLAMFFSDQTFVCSFGISSDMMSFDTTINTPPWLLLLSFGGHSSL